MLDAHAYGPWALIAGASEGVGVAFAHRLARAGINLVLLARQKNLLEDVARRVRAESAVQVRVLSCDLAADDMLDRVRDATRDVEVGLLVVNAAASPGGGSFLDAPIESVLKAVRVGPVSIVSLAHHFGSQMAARGRGGILFIGSLAGNAGASTVAFYSAAKAFSQIFAEGLWSELKPRGVDVLYAVLGAVRTPARERAGYQDSPEVADPDDVARDCLENLDNGPVFVPAQLAQAFQMFSSMPRRQAAESMSELLQSYQRQ